MAYLGQVVRRETCEVVVWTAFLLGAVFANTSAMQLDYQGAVLDYADQNNRDMYYSLRKFKNFFRQKENLAIMGGIAAGALVVLLLLIIVTLCLCYFCRVCCFKRHSYAAERKRLIGRFRPPDASFSDTRPCGVEVRSQKQRQERTVAEEMNRQKDEQEQLDRDNAKYVVEFYLRNNSTFKMVKYLPDMGSRMLKYWFIVEDRSDHQQLLTIGPVSRKCPLTLDNSTVKTLNKLLSMLSHPHLYNVGEVFYMVERKQVILIQQINTAGSLKDCIYRSAFATEWTMKYSLRNRGLATQRIALYGRQILEGLRYLYKQGFPPLGHVQTGNIFVDEDVCQLGGYENTLLGYKTRSYKLCKCYMDDIDLILFGHAIFEMACGYELTLLVPGEPEYKSVCSSRVKTVLQVIFDRENDGCFTSSIDKVYKLPFFQDVDLPVQEGARSDKTQFPSDVRNLLAKVSKDRSRGQRSSSRSRRKKPSHTSDAAHSATTSTSTALTTSTSATPTSTCTTHTSVSMGVFKSRGGVAHTKPFTKPSSASFHKAETDQTKSKTSALGSKSKLQNAITDDSSVSKV